MSPVYSTKTSPVASQPGSSTVPDSPPGPHIALRGLQQNNLASLDLDLPLGELIVITGVSGSGKSSLAFDTLYAEGQRRYLETFSAYARQFLDRLDRPAAERIDGIPPAIAIDQTNPVRTSRSTVGTLTELNDHLKLLFARAARLFCRGCGRAIQRDTPETIWNQLRGDPRSADQAAAIAFAVAVPAEMGAMEVKSLLAQQGYVRILNESEGCLEVIQDRLRLAKSQRSRGIEALETALARGHGQLRVYPLDQERRPGEPLRFSAALHCPDCDIAYAEPTPNRFSFNSPLAACPSCRGFGRTIGIDWSLVIPDPSKSLLEGAVKPIQSDGYAEIQEDLIGFAHRRGVPTDLPWRALEEADRHWVIEGEGEGESGVWYGLKRFFAWLEARSYKMHVRVLLSRYRAYEPCTRCHGARLIDESLDWRLGDTTLAERALAPKRRFRHDRVMMDPRTWQTLPGLNLHDLLCLPIRSARLFCDALALDPALDPLIGAIRTRLGYLDDVGLGYLTLERQSRTLSGGEVQRINLTTALGSTLVNALFVLDEPSIGLHPRDLERIIRILEKLRDQGNSLVVVEHDPQVMRAADRIIELGPGPGEQGGRICFNGTPEQLIATPGVLSGDYLAGRRQVAGARKVRVPDRDGPAIELRGARAHNLKGIDVKIPLGRLVVVTGVSGSGKSTLVQDVLYQALCQRKGHPVEHPGEYDGIEGDEAIIDVELLDQSSIGRTSRSNPASYVGVFDILRKRFAAQPLARERGYTAGTFSFNSGAGRCPTCGGSGFEHIEMQFLADVYLRCPDCDGRRYRSSVLEVTLTAAPSETPRSIADVLDLTAAEVQTIFARDTELCRALAPLLKVGLGYLRLGQPLPTLSGGEAQRLKLAGHLAKAGRRVNGRQGGILAQGGATQPQGGLLFLLDEPTTGLHFADVAVLLEAFQHLLDAGHSLLVIEHHLDLIDAADWIIELGPDGGEGGGHLVCAGTPETIMSHPASATGSALAAYRTERASSRALGIAEPVASACWSRSQPMASDAGHHPASAIDILHAREHNLKDLSLQIPRDRFVVITGVSGSGKSTLAFDILFAEGQRRFLESLNAYARQFVQPATRPDVDAVLGLPPTVAIAQRTSRGGVKSTLGTLTEIHHALRLLYCQLGTQHCPSCAIPIEPMSRDAILARIEGDHAGQTVALMAPLVQARKGLYKDLAEWAVRQGWFVLRVDGEPVETTDWPVLDRYREHSIALPLGEVRVHPEESAPLQQLLDQALEVGKGSVLVIQVEDGVWGAEKAYSSHRACPSCGLALPELDPRLFSFNSKRGWCPNCFGSGLAMAGFDGDQTGEEEAWQQPHSGVSGRRKGPTDSTPCPSCHGARLNPEAQAVRFRGRSIAEFSALSIAEAAVAISGLCLDAREQAIAGDLLADIRERLTFLIEVGLGYLTLDRAAPGLSGGEAQRTRLAAQLGSNLRGVCYILDEPTIGLHARDNERLLDSLVRLQAKGNSLLVVEHDEATMRRADTIFDLGPGAGHQGGALIAQGSIAALMANPASVTGQWLARPKHRMRPARPWSRRDPALSIKGVRRHNLYNLSVRIPLARLVAVTGVSGSGKSTLVRDLLVPALRHHLGSATEGERIQGLARLEGWAHITRVLEVDQTPIGKTPRSCPATYVGIWDPIRRLFAATPQARLLGWGPTRFSFNVSGGRCPACEGQGQQRLEMSFLPDAYLTCESCDGTRFTRDTREVRYRGFDIGQILALNVDDARPLFEVHPSIAHTLELLHDVGLGYLPLGQPSPTLSGGEAQRLKLVSELAKARTSTRPTLYVLDEPTVGLHMADVERLIQALHALVDAGHSVLVIEHNLDLIAAADWLIDLGPEAGDAGGRIVAEGTPEWVVANADSATAKALRGRQH